MFLRSSMFLHRIVPALAIALLLGTRDAPSAAFRALPVLRRNTLALQEGVS